MNIFQMTLSLATLLCSLVAGFLFAFAIVVMPGIKQLTDREYIRAFQVMDGIIQRNQPIFVLIWIGSIVAILAVVVLGVSQLNGFNRFLLIVAAAIYLVGVQLPTGIVNVPLNNQLQALDVETMTEPDQQKARQNFELPWNKWNTIRTALAILTSSLLVILLSKI